MFTKKGAGILTNIYAITAPVIVPIGEAHRGYNGGFTEYQAPKLNHLDPAKPPRLLLV